MDAAYSCPECALPFRSEGLMAKHRAHLCFGPPVDQQIDNELFQSRIEELKRLKQRKSELHLERETARHRSAENDRYKENDLNMINGSDTERLFNQPESENQWNRRSNGLRKLQTQGHNKEFSSRGFKEVSHSSPVCRESSVSSISIQLSPSPIEEQKNQVMSDELYRQIETQANIYLKTIQDFKQRNEELAVQKEEIERRLRLLENHQQQQQPGDGSTVLFNELKSQQEQNQMNFLKLQQQQQPQSQNQMKLGEEEKQDLLLKEINAVRMRYLQNGGNNPEILMDIAKMERDAIILLKENIQMEQQDMDGIEKYKALSQQLELFEVENKKLEEELVRVHEANTEKLQNETLDYDNNLAEDLLTERRNHQLKEMEKLEEEIELANRQIRLNGIKKRLEKLRVQQNFSEEDSSTSLNNEIVKLPGILTGPYDPSLGFVAFYDYLTGLDDDTLGLRLLVGIYSTTYEYAKPITLPFTPVMQPSSQKHYSLGNVVFLRAKQPVPHCSPANDLGLVLELQTISGSEAQLSTKCWCKIDLFDEMKCLRTGAWRVPFRILPVRSTIRIPDLSAVQKYANREIFLRLVNYRDSDNQSLSHVSLANHTRYQHADSIQVKSRTT